MVNRRRMVRWRLVMVTSHMRSALVAHQEGRLAVARLNTRIALRLADGTSRPTAVAEVLVLMSRMEEIAGDLGAAYARATQACAVLASDLGSGEARALMPRCLRQVGAVLMQRGDNRAAEQVLHNAVNFAAGLDRVNAIEVAHGYNLLGTLYESSGRCEEAESAFEQVSKLAEAHNLPADRFGPRC